jgi:hypothetical protein
LQIKVNETAAALRTSTTPIREALSRLVGEELVEDRRRIGFFVPAPTAYELIDLYSLSETLLIAAVRKQAEPLRPKLDLQLPPSPPSAAGGDSVGLLLGTLLERSGNLALVETGSRILDRLAAARRSEPLVLTPEEQGLQELEGALTSDNEARLLAGLRRYHRVRRSRADRLSYALGKAPGSQ